MHSSFFISLDEPLTRCSALENGVLVVVFDGLSYFSSKIIFILMLCVLCIMYAKLFY